MTEILLKVALSTINQTSLKRFRNQALPNVLITYCLNAEYKSKLICFKHGFRRAWLVCTLPLFP
jgi:hypothetical protein